MILCTFGGGCALFRPDEPLNYQTVEADPRYNTTEAAEEHEKALVIIEKYFDDRPCLIQHKHVDLIQAEQHLQKALIEDVTYGPAHNTLGTIYYWQRKYYLAAWEFEYAIKLMPDKAEPLFNLGLVYEDSEQLDRATEYFSRAMMLDDRDPNIMIAYIRVEMRQGRTIDEMRPMIKKFLFYETRPEWIAWAKDQVGEHPEQVACVNIESLSKEEAQPTPVEEPYPALIPPEPINENKE
ncbi:MAG: hypothetical protein R3C11_24630 [Planctomycetaceae bacterium]